MDIKEILKWASAVVAAVVIALVGGHAGLFGSVTSPATNLDYLELSQGFKLPAGPSVTTANQGTVVQAMLQGSCNPTFNGSSLAATTTGQFFCSVTGVASGDKVFISLPSGAAQVLGGINAVGNGYATTTGVIAFDLVNLTGTATTSFPQATTTVKYWVVR